MEISRFVPCEKKSAELLTRLADGVHPLPQQPVRGRMSALNAIIDAVDPMDRVVGKVSRRDALQAGVNFRVVHVFVFNTAGELLLQQIGPGLRHAGTWGSSAAGYLNTGEPYDQAATRKVTSELGVGLPLRFVGRTSMVDQASIKFIALFDAHADGPFQMNADQVSALSFQSLAKIAADRDEGVRTFTPTFVHLLDAYRIGALQP
jgi:isopentenyl-diphosphate delta-isomerase